MEKPTQPDTGLSRRRFLQSSAAAGLAGALAGSLVIPRSVHAAGSDALRIGLIGCGGRGTGACRQALSADPGAVLVAMGDAFADRLQASLKTLKDPAEDKTNIIPRLQVDPDHCFVGFDAYKKVIESVDVVLLTTPPHFRPAHLRAAIEAGKHVFAEKPVAVDAPGVRSVLASAQLAKDKNLSLVSGFCWRYNNAERAAFQQIHDGAIGDILTLYHTYNTTGLWQHPRQDGWSDMENQLRNWLYYSWLSGDHICEQAVHSIDKMAWAMGDVMPVKAVAHGGRQVRTEERFGNIFDHFSVVYDFPAGQRGFLFCRQEDGCATDTSDHITGSKAVCDINGGQNLHRIHGGATWDYPGPRNNMYQTEHDELFAAIRAGKPINNGVRMANSTMMAILGRMAAYTGKAITWDQAINSKEDMTPAKYEWGPMPVGPVAMPGKTAFL